MMKSQIFQMQLENDDLRARLLYMEALKGKDSFPYRDNSSSETGNIDWAQILLDENTDDRVINASREKIAHQLIKLKNEKIKLEKDMKEKRIKNALDTNGLMEMLNARPSA